MDSILFHLEVRIIVWVRFLSNHLLLPPTPAGSPTFNQRGNEAFNMPKGFLLSYLLHLHHIYAQPGLEPHRCLETGPRGPGQCWISNPAEMKFSSNSTGILWKSQGCDKIQELALRNYRPWEKSELPFSALSVIGRPVL